ncbi:VanZ family protein [Dyadobacter sp. CY107]|uniref:VanZ family protein n=1 Tax=Dyadobacter fanqingshengii TaxID=2906443 RepID=UPI001F42AD1B|nr:VanZ family protein [Dyadobacter fanqingshengii]MCF2501777.1 VanZ family protein [Dyadobacter fanqingshengii]
MFPKFFQSIIQLLSRSPWIAWFWTFLILLACTWPGKDIPSAPVAGFDKIVHGGLFIIWITLWTLIYPKKATLLVLLGMAYGLGLEFYQQLLPFDRTFDWWDAVADTAGVLIGFAFKSLVIDRYRHRLY